MKKYIQDFTIVSNEKVNADHFVIVAEAPSLLPLVLPGQFVEILVKNNIQVFLRRPLSIHDVDYSRNTMSFLVQIVGEGTKTLSEVKIGEKMNIMYPLGNFFSLPGSNDFLLVGGGCGVAPLLYFSKYLKQQGFYPKVIIGAFSKQSLIRIEEMKKYADVFVTTEDGSEGEKGLVTDHSMLNNDNTVFNKIYTCGPEQMMKALARYAKEKGIECEVSLENSMACGIGACLCCVVETVEGNKCTCTEGPVFNINVLKW